MRCSFLSIVRRTVSVGWAVKTGVTSTRSSNCIIVLAFTPWSFSVCSALAKDAPTDTSLRRWRMRSAFSATLTRPK